MHRKMRKFYSLNRNFLRQTAADKQFSTIWM